jgi:hypothetical protein
LREDALDDRRLQDGSDDLQLASTVQAVLAVDLENVPECGRAKLIN